MENLYLMSTFASTEIMYHQNCPDRMSLPWQSCLTTVSERLVALLTSGMRSDVTLHLEGRTLKVSTKTALKIMIIVAVLFFFKYALPLFTKYFINYNRTSKLTALFSPRRTVWSLPWTPRCLTNCCMATKTVSRVCSPSSTRCKTIRLRHSHGCWSTCTAAIPTSLACPWRWRSAFSPPSTRWGRSSRLAPKWGFAFRQRNFCLLLLFY